MGVNVDFCNLVSAVQRHPNNIGIRIRPNAARAIVQRGGGVLQGIQLRIVFLIRIGDLHASLGPGGREHNLGGFAGFRIGDVLVRWQSEQR